MHLMNQSSGLHLYSFLIKLILLRLNLFFYGTRNAVGLDFARAARGRGQRASIERRLAMQGAKSGGGRVQEFLAILSSRPLAAQLLYRLSPLPQGPHADDTAAHGRCDCVLVEQMRCALSHDGRGIAAPFLHHALKARQSTAATEGCRDGLAAIDKGPPRAKAAPILRAHPCPGCPPATRLSPCQSRPLARALDVCM